MSDDDIGREWFGEQAFQAWWEAVKNLEYEDGSGMTKEQARAAFMEGFNDGQ